MNFDFSDDAKALRDQARRFLEERAGAAVARKAMDGDAAYDADLWKSVVELGWTAARVPEAHGGIGLSAEEACVLAEEVGRSLIPVPFVSTLIATEALLLGSEAQQAKWLPGIADSSVIATVGWAEGDTATPSRTSGVTASGDKLSGVKMPVPDLQAANLAIITAAGPDGPSLYLVDLKGTGVTVEAAPTLDLVRRHGKLTLNGAPAEALGDAATFQTFLDRAAVLSAWEAIGTGSVAMEMAIGYAKERVAFGQKIGRYQGVKHKCADMYVKLELARAHALHGAWAMATEAPELAQAAAAARVSALDALKYAAEENVQLHGGIGFTWESDCQFYYRRGRQIAFALGSRSWWADRLVRTLERRNARAA
ncbi:acyl-CoA dehydrogenase family protein [Sphingoaurantiacus capsulatus]|uniref:Acyl-CoA dehydrogenase family protein n=1 Tax=Sphingoaurantiacus capsulatus TaxID=1771310 RepID=A0ABV7X8X8_9SPHN